MRKVIGSSPISSTKKEHHPNGWCSFLVLADKDSNRCKCNADERCPLRSVAAEHLFSFACERKCISSSISSTTHLGGVLFWFWPIRIRTDVNATRMSVARCAPSQRNIYFLSPAKENAYRVLYRPPYMKNPNYFTIGSAFGFFVYIKDITY